MANRYKYGISCSAFNSADFFEVVPIYYQETAPGETYSGKLTTKIQSLTATQRVNNRTFVDVIGVYCPYRLLFNEWPEYIASDDHTGSLPTVTDIMPKNFENHLAISGTSNIAFPRLMYNAVTSTIFRHDEDDSWWQSGDTSATSNTVRKCHHRPSRLETSFMEQADFPEHSVTLTEGTPNTLYTSSIRDAFAQDAREQMQQIYGTGYTDYLTRLGVQWEGEVQGEPEVLTKAGSNLNFVLTASTGEDTTNKLGDVGGRFEGTVTTAMKRKFIPEHGLIGFYAVVKMEVPMTNFAGMSVLQKDHRTDYWSPEFEHMAVKDYDGYYVAAGASNEGTVAFRTAHYEDYRKPSTLIGNWTGGNYLKESRTASNIVLDDYLRNQPEDTAFNDGDTKPHIQFTTDVSMQKLSPVSPVNKRPALR